MVHYKDKNIIDIKEVTDNLPNNGSLTDISNKLDSIDTSQQVKLKYVSLSFASETGTHDIVTATDGDIYIEDVLIYSVTSASDLTSVSILTDDNNPFVIMTTVEGAQASLTSQTTIKTDNSQKSFYLTSSKKLQYTIDGTGSWSAYILIKYRIQGSGSLE